MDQAKLRWGVLGCANIAIGQSIPGMQQSKRSVVTAIASRDEEKARGTAEKLGIQKAYGSYEALLADDTVDAVYIPLPNHLHKEWTLKAAAAGKHVLCEKPFAMNAAEAQEMVSACEQAGVVIAEAFMYRHHPRYAQTRELIAAGEVGERRGIHGTFTFNSASRTGNFRTEQEMGGGAMYDIGVYPISAARMILEAEPEAATVHALFSNTHGGVDMMASGLLEFPKGVGLTFDCAMWAAFRNTLEILGAEGRIEMPSAFICNPSEASSFFVTTGSGRREVVVSALNHFSQQADDFAAVALDGAPQAFKPGDAVQGMRALDACLLSARTHARVTI